jgi:hypothetical protein
MKINRVWEGVEKTDRRQHNHRCTLCRRILSDGEPALFYRFNKGTRACHIECADVDDAGMTTRQRFHAWAAA